MKIEWVNASADEAIVTVGWWRRRRAHVATSGYYWRFKSTGRRLSWWLSLRLDRGAQRERRRLEALAAEGREWEPVGELPVVRLLKPP